MASVSDWSANEKENTNIDELTLSGEGGKYINKIMCAVKGLSDESVHKTGTEEITGAKTFKAPVSINPTSAGNTFLFLKNSNAKGTDSPASGGVVYVDKNGSNEKNRLGSLTYSITGAGNSKAILGAYNNIAESTDNTRVIVSADKSGDASVSVNADFIPETSEDANLGAPSKLWNDIYAVNTTIQTSDEKQKQDIEEFPSEVLDAWEDVRFYCFKLTASVAKKGESARLHSGLIAQRIHAVFEAHGLDAFRLGLLCRDVGEGSEWTERIIEREAEFDDAGTLIAAEVFHDVIHRTAPYDRWGVRYAEALCLEAACSRRRVGRLESRLAALEAQIDGK